jgi:hypothetical protein
VDDTLVEFELGRQEYEKLEAAARARHLSAEELARDAVVDWLERQEKLDLARALMRELGQGLGQGNGANDIARNHDAYLYG